MEVSNTCQNAVPSTTSSVSVPNTNWWEDLDVENDDDVDLEELGRALSEAASLASISKEQSGNGHSEKSVKPSPLKPRLGSVNDIKLGTVCVLR